MVDEAKPDDTHTYTHARTHAHIHNINISYSVIKVSRQKIAFEIHYL